MSATSTSPNRSYPVVNPGDKPTWIGDFDGLVMKLDTDVQTALTNATNAQTSATSANTTATNAVNTANATAQSILTTNTNVSTLTSTVNSQGTEIANLTNTVNANHVSDSNAWNTIAVGVNCNNSTTISDSTYANANEFLVEISAPGGYGMTHIIRKSFTDNLYSGTNSAGWVGTAIHMSNTKTISSITVYVNGVDVSSTCGYDIFYR